MEEFEIIYEYTCRQRILSDTRLMILRWCRQWQKFQTQLNNLKSFLITFMKSNNHNFCCARIRSHIVLYQTKITGPKSLYDWAKIYFQSIDFDYCDNTTVLFQKIKMRLNAEYFRLMTNLKTFLQCKIFQKLLFKKKIRCNAVKRFLWHKLFIQSYNYV